MADERSIFDYIQQVMEQAKSRQDTSGDFAPHEDQPGSAGVASSDKPPMEHYMDTGAMTRPEQEPWAGYQIGTGYEPSALERYWNSKGLPVEGQLPEGVNWADENGPTAPPLSWRTSERPAPFAGGMSYEPESLDGMGAPLAAADTVDGPTRLGSAQGDTPYAGRSGRIGYQPGDFAEPMAARDDPTARFYAYYLSGKRGLQ